MTNSADPDQLVQKPTDLDLHCLLRQGMSCSAKRIKGYYMLKKHNFKGWLDPQSRDTYLFVENICVKIISKFLYASQLYQLDTNYWHKVTKEIYRKFKDDLDLQGRDMGLACDKWSWPGVHLCQIRFIYNIYMVWLCPRDYALNWKKKNYAPDITRNVSVWHRCPHPGPSSTTCRYFAKNEVEKRDKSILF